jgi:hypothetical protein
MKAAILNGGRGSWAFSELATQLQEALWLEVVVEPVDLNYVLFYDGDEPPECFIPVSSIDIASDKRVQTELFTAAGVPMPETILLPNPKDVRRFVNENADRRWVLKYPIGCGAAGHRILDRDTQIRDDWPTPFIVQEFIEMDDPVVYRVYATGGRLFGFNERRFGDPSARRSPFVAHATGASYGLLDDTPVQAARSASAALEAVGLDSSFGCVDLLRADDEWLVIEVGTDGLYNYVDRAVPEPLATELDRQVAQAFWERLGEQPPWGSTWRRRPLS